MNFRVRIILILTCVFKMAAASKSHEDQDKADDSVCRQSCSDRRCQEITVVSNRSETVETTVVDHTMSGVQLDSITLTAYHSQSDNREACGRSSGTHVIVDDGCQAKFWVCLQRLGCQSKRHEKLPEQCQNYNLVSKDQMEMLPVGTAFGYVTSMKLLHQKSSVPCVQGRTFGFYKWIAFVRKGCSGRFKICYESTADDSDVQNPDTMFPPTDNPNWSCVDVEIVSRVKRPVEKTITDDDGNGVVIKSMSVVKQHSAISCEEGETFGSYGSVASAWGGCAGTFKVCYDTKVQQPATTFKPEIESLDLKCVNVKLLSRIKRPVHKTITDDYGKEVTINSMTLVDQHSDISCDQGETFGSNGSVASAWGGCRGTFKICYGRAKEEPTDEVKRASPHLKCVDVDLSSRVKRPVERTMTEESGKPVTIHSMALVNQRSDISCEHGESYSSAGNVARVWGGCGGTFRVCYEPVDVEDQDQIEVLPESSKQRCVDVNLLSRVNRPVEKAMTDEDGKAVIIQTMTLVHQQSDIYCGQGKSYSASGSVARAWGGCRGIFRICYSA